MDRARAQLILSLLLVLVAVAGNVLRVTAPPDPGALGLADADLPDLAAPYEEETLEPEFFDVLRAREVMYRTYEPDAEEPVWVFLAYFDRQREGSQVHSPRHCYPGSGWNIEHEIGWPAPWGGEVRSLIVHDGVERRIVCYWYQTPTRILPDVMPLKLALVGEALRRRPQEVVFASISTPFVGEADAAVARIRPYAQGAETEIERLYEVRDGNRTRP